MRLIARGIRFTLTGGRLTPAAQEAYKALQELGEEVRFSSKTQVLVRGPNFAWSFNSAIDRAIPIIDEHQLIELVREGKLEVSSPLDMSGGDTPMEELMGEVRAVISTPSALKTWQQLCELMDACQPSHQAQLADYINAHMERWDIEDQLLCVAPHAWLLQMIAGQNLEKFKLVRKLDFFGKRNTGTNILGALRNDTLTHLLSLHAHVENDLSETLMRSLHTLPSCEDLVELGFGSINPPVSSALAQGDGLEQVTRFIYADNAINLEYGHRDIEHLRELPFLDSLQSLTLTPIKAGRVLRQQEELDLSALSTFNLSLLPHVSDATLNEGLNQLLDIIQPHHVVFGVHGNYRWLRCDTPIELPRSVKTLSIHGILAHAETQWQKQTLRQNFASLPQPDGVPVTLRGYSYDTLLNAASRSDETGRPHT